MTLAPFPAEGKTLRASWADWETQVFDYLEMATGDPWGLMGFAMPAEAFAIATDGAGVHAPQVLLRVADSKCKRIKVINFLEIGK